MKRDIRKAVEEIKSAGMEDFLHQDQVLLSAMMINSLIINVLQDVNALQEVDVQEQDVLA